MSAVHAVYPHNADKSDTPALHSQAFNLRVQLVSAKSPPAHLVCHSVRIHIDPVPRLGSCIPSCDENVQLQVAVALIVSLFDLLLEAPQVRRRPIQAMQEEDEVDVLGVVFTAGL